MIKVNCDNCEKTDLPFNETLKVDGKVYCKDCLEQHFPEQNALNDKLVDDTLDPTVCSVCKTDFGTVELSHVGRYPFCDDCKVALDQKILPTWVKGFLITVLIIIVSAFVWNWKFYSAYQNFFNANELMGKGEVSQAAKLMTKASEQVTQVNDLKVLAAYFRAIDFMQTDHSAEALIELEQCRTLPPEYEVDAMIAQANVGAAFDNKDYPGFLEANLEQLALQPNEPIAIAGVASAYACMHAVYGDSTSKSNAESYLNQAKTLDDTSEYMLDYYNFIEFRLDSRVIITHEKFDEKFPNGWTKN